MAIARMRKVVVLGYRPVMDDVIGALQQRGVLQIDLSSYDLPNEEVRSDDRRLRQLDEQSADAHFVRDFLGRFHVSEQPFSAFVAEKFHVDREEYLAMSFDNGGRQLYEECVSLSDEMASGEREIERLKQLLQDLEPWRDFHHPISAWHGTETTSLFTGTVPAYEGGLIRERLRSEVAEVTVDELGPVGDRQAWVVIAHKSSAHLARSVLASTGFAEVSFPGITGVPADEIESATQRWTELTVRIAELETRATELSAGRYRQAVAMVQAIDSERERLTVRRDFARTDHVFVITGWLVAVHESEIESALESFSSDIDLTFEDPGDDDNPPVQLENPRWLKPFEVLTDLYGRPAYGELDPTPLLAPFFLTFFAICIGDVGYGAMLIAGSWAIKTKLDVTAGVKRFMDLMMLGGAAAMVAGVAFGSYFALPIDLLPPFLRSLQILDPLGELTTFLLFTLVLGVVQVFFGVVVAAYDAFRRGDPTEAVFGQLSTIFMFAMIAVFAITGIGLFLSIGLVGTMVMQGRAIQAAVGTEDRPAWDRMLGWLWLATTLAATVLMGIGQAPIGLALLGGGSLLLAIVSKSARAAVIALLGGAYAVYGMSAFVGDTLSYTRLAALGLSGSLVGFVFNLLAGLVWGPAVSLFEAGGVSVVFGVLIAVLAAAVFVVGHVFNVVINLLGAFVHPARLQFVEFFSKFYEAGGRPFSPFRVRDENLVLEAGRAGSEGGAG